MSVCQQVRIRTKKQSSWHSATRVELSKKKKVRKTPSLLCLHTFAWNRSEAHCAPGQERSLAASRPPIETLAEELRSTHQACGRATCPLCWHEFTTTRSVNTSNFVPMRIVFGSPCNTCGAAKEGVTEAPFSSAFLVPKRNVHLSKRKVCGKWQASPIERHVAQQHFHLGSQERASPNAASRQELAATLNPRPNNIRRCRQA